MLLQYYGIMVLTLRVCDQSELNDFIVQPQRVI